MDAITSKNMRGEQQDDGTYKLSCKIEAELPGRDQKTPLTFSFSVGNDGRPLSSKAFLSDHKLAMDFSLVTLERNIVERKVKQLQDVIPDSNNWDWDTSFVEALSRR